MDLKLLSLLKIVLVILTLVPKISFGEALQDFRPGDPQFAPSGLLPLAINNSWVYSKDGNNVTATLGSVEDLGGLCIRPLIFSDNNLILYLANHDSRIVLYGIQANVEISGAESSSFERIMFQDGSFSSFESGLLLTDTDDSTLGLAEGTQFRGTYSGTVLGSPQEIQWLIENQNVSDELESASYDGQVAGSAVSVNSDAVRRVSFRLRLGPSESFAGDLRLDLLPGVGISELRLAVDGPADVYRLLQAPNDGFSLESELNQLSVTDCGVASFSSLSRTDSGYMQTWTNITLLFIVLLRLLNPRENWA